MIEMAVKMKVKGSDALSPSVHIAGRAANNVEVDVRIPLGKRRNNLHSLSWVDVPRVSDLNAVGVPGPMAGERRKRGGLVERRRVRGTRCDNDPSRVEMGESSLVVGSHDFGGEDQAAKTRVLKET